MKIGETNYEAEIPWGGCQTIITLQNYRNLKKMIIKKSNSNSNNSEIKINNDNFYSNRLSSNSSYISTSPGFVVTMKLLITRVMLEQEK